MDSKLKCFYAKRGKRLCKTCDHPYTMITGGTALRGHMWGKHPLVARRNDVPPLSSHSSSPNSRHLSFSSSAAPIVVEGDDIAPALSPSIFFSSSSSSSSSCSSSSSSSAVVVRPGVKRVSASPLQQPVGKKAKQVTLGKWVSTASGEISKKAVEAMVDFFLYENIAFRLAESPKLLAWLDLYRKGGSELAKRKQMVWIGHQRAEAVRTQVVARL